MIQLLDLKEQKMKLPTNINFRKSFLMKNLFSPPTYNSTKHRINLFFYDTDKEFDNFQLKGKN